MTKTLEALFDRLEIQRQALFASLTSVSESKLHQAPYGKWSVIQILNHLVSAERLSVMYLQKKIQAIDQTDRSGILEELKMVLLIVSQRLPGLKFKAPKVVVEMTPTSGDLESISKEWERVRAELKSLLEKIPEGKETKLIYKHVRAGRLNTVHALKFFREHIIHHTPQIKKLL